MNFLFFRAAGSALPVFRNSGFSFGLLFLFTCCACSSEPAQSQTFHAKKKNKQEQVSYQSDRQVTVLQRWELPVALTEISGNDFYKGQLACIQDEEGIIFLFDPASGSVTRQIPFGDPGDYEGIAVSGETAWVLRSDGVLFEVRNFASGAPGVHTYPTPLTRKQDTEGLCLDTARNRLLVSVKAKDPESNEFKGVYAFDLNTHQMDPNPVYRLTVKTYPVDARSQKQKKVHHLQPSEIALHPATGDLYVLDGSASVLYRMDAAGMEQQAWVLDKALFPQPEGLSITADGHFYISTEGRGGKAALARVTLP